MKYGFYLVGLRLATLALGTIACMVVMRGIAATWPNSIAPGFIEWRLALLTQAVYLVCHASYNEGVYRYGEGSRR